MATGTDVIKLANKHVGEQYIFGAFAPKDNANWKGPWDCAEFASWVAFQITGVLLGCLNDSDNPALADAFSGAWARDAAAAHLPISIGQASATAGAVLIRKPAPTGTGHVAISQGDGTTVEAHSSAKGVCNARVDGRRWDLAMLLPLVDYPDELESAVVRPPSGLELRLASPPMSGALVKPLQRKLKARGIDPGEIDGVFGPHTDAAVRAFQLQAGLVPDGEAGDVTLEQLGVNV